jgi:hypothetical protein
MLCRISTIKMVARNRLHVNLEQFDTELATGSTSLLQLPQDLADARPGNFPNHWCSAYYGIRKPHTGLIIWG